MAGSCERGNEPAVSIKCGELLERLRNHYPLKKDSTSWALLLLVGWLIDWLVDCLVD